MGKLPTHLGDVIALLIQAKDSIVNEISRERCVALQQPAMHGPLETNVPLYVFVPVFLDAELSLPGVDVQLCFVNNGIVPFSPGEHLGRYVLDPLSHLQNGELCFPAIMEDFHLDSSGDLAGFVGVFLVSEG